MPIERPPSPVTRRGAVLGGIGLAAGLGAVPAAPVLADSGAPPTLRRFLALSRALTGARNLDEGMARGILAGLLAEGRAEDLRRLEADPAGQLGGELAGEIIAAWYSGLFRDGSGATVADLNGALLWEALGFTKPWGTCGGETGYWSDPPSL